MPKPAASRRCGCVIRLNAANGLVPCSHPLSAYPLVLERIIDDFHSRLRLRDPPQLPSNFQRPIDPADLPLQAPLGYVFITVVWGRKFMETWTKPISVHEFKKILFKPLKKQFADDPKDYITDIYETVAHSPVPRLQGEFDHWFLIVVSEHAWYDVVDTIDNDPELKRKKYTVIARPTLVGDAVHLAPYIAPSPIARPPPHPAVARAKKSGASIKARLAAESAAQSAAQSAALAVAQDATICPHQDLQSALLSPAPNPPIPSTTTSTHASAPAADTAGKATDIDHTDDPTTVAASLSTRPTSPAPPAASSHTPQPTLASEPRQAKMFTAADVWGRPKVASQKAVEKGRVHHRATKGDKGFETVQKVGKKVMDGSKTQVTAPVIEKDPPNSVTSTNKSIVLSSSPLTGLGFPDLPDLARLLEEAPIEQPAPSLNPDARARLAPRNQKENAAKSTSVTGDPSRLAKRAHTFTPPSGPLRSKARFDSPLAHGFAEGDGVPAVRKKGRKKDARKDKAPAAVRGDLPS